MAEHLVIIGNGMVGLRFVEELVGRAAGRFRLTVIGKEAEPAYNRVLLSSLLAGEIGANDIRCRDRDWYAARGIALALGDPVVAIDPAGCTVMLGSGRPLAFDRLVLATGSQPIRLPIAGMDLPGVLPFRDRADVDAIRAAAAVGRPAVVIGGGLLGIEAAYGLAQTGAAVTLVHVMDRLMERQLDARAARLLKHAVEAKGVNVLLEAETAMIVGCDRVAGVRLKDGRELPADLVVVAIGVRPETKLAKGAGLACARGIVVDNSLETSVNNIYAIGECAEHRGVCYGLVEPGYAQARVLAERLAGGDATYLGLVLATNLKVSGVRVFSTSDFLGGVGAQEIVLSDPGLPAYKKLVVRRDDGGRQRLIGAVLFGETGDGLWYQELIRTGTPIDAMRAGLIFGRDFVEAAA